MDLARYPFTTEAADYVSSRGGLTLSELGLLPQLLEAAATRVERAIAGSALIETPDEDMAILSFPASILLLSVIGNQVLSDKYASGEAKSLEHVLGREPSWKIVRIATRTMRWALDASATTVGDCAYEFRMDFVSYLKALPRQLVEPSLKLVNRPLIHGKVLLTRAELASLVARGLRTRILQRLEELAHQPLPQVPQPIKDKADELRGRLIRLKVMQRHPDAFPKGIMWMAAPPCMRKLRRELVNGSDIRPMGSFAFTAFLLGLGSPRAEVDRFLSIFGGQPAVAVDLVARGRYSVPSCATMKRHGVCYNPDSLCRRIDRPSAYYKSKLEAWKARVTRKAYSRHGERSGHS